MDFALLNDEPVTDLEADLLGTARAAREPAGLLHASRTATPFTLAVDAGWGMGKSSLMRLVEAELRQHRDVATVWYNAWTSTGSDALEGLPSWRASTDGCCGGRCTTPPRGARCSGRCARR
ncbi:P-loop NTPase fold protein [Streptomyces sp. NPDC050164]|uniref:P-loop NTPase fold protein n=1 Tax=Streptomyces sp. NPDC050164 TaxID=3365605 RepID=UPI0037A518C5